jgi:hypothetical protein
MSGEASSAGHGQEAGMFVYMPWPRSGRMQYEETNKQTIHTQWPWNAGFKGENWDFGEVFSWH